MLNYESQHPKMAIDFFFYLKKFIVGVLDN